jgi:hypothetical protein
MGSLGKRKRVGLNFQKTREKIKQISGDNRYEKNVST